MQQRRFIFYIATVLIAANGYAHALDVKVLPTSSKFAKIQDVEVILQFNNTDSRTLSIYNWHLPQKELNDPIFQVTCNGKPVQYLGKLIKRRAPTPDDTTSLAPGQVIKSAVVLSSAYDMSETGNYVIEYKMDLDRVLFTRAGTPRSAGASSNDDHESILPSASTTLFVEGRRNALIEQNGKAVGQERMSKTTYTLCSPIQSTSIAAGLTAAASTATSALNYLKTTSPSSTSRYVTWFGQFSLANWNTVKTHFTNIQEALSNKPYTFDCSTCKLTNTFAYVYASMPYRVYLCSAFWAAQTTGTDSKAGTLVHETSHFTVIAGTQDIVYGKSACMNLAKSKPAQTLTNADTHEYFAENNPLLK